MTTLPAITGTGTTIYGSTVSSGQILAPHIVLDGSQSGGNGLEVNADNTTIGGMDIINWDNGIQIDNVKSTVLLGNYIGIEADGNTAAGNGNGVFVNSGAT